jgi:hypothetical protein
LHNRFKQGRDYGNQWYCHGQDRLGEGLLDETRPISLTNLRYTELHPHQWYLRSYKQSLDEVVRYPEYNFIYRVDTSLDILEPGPDLIDHLIEADLLPRDTEVSLTHGLTYVIGNMVDYAGERAVRHRFDGFHPPDQETIGVWPEVVQTHAVLVDGHAMRHQDDRADTNVDLTPPSGVIDDLQEYTTYLDHTLRPETIRWLERHYTVPYNQTRLYRGFDMRIYPQPMGYSIDAMNRALGDYMDVTVDRLHQGASVDITRGKVSSWSRTPEVARAFGPNRDEADDSIRVMVKTTAGPDDILLDFTTLPDSLLEQFEAFGLVTLNEVLLKEGPVEAILDGVYADGGTVDWFHQQGYDFENGYGVIT